MEKRLKNFLPEIKDYYSVNSNGEFFSDNSGKMKTRNRSGTDYQIINFMLENQKHAFRTGLQKARKGEKSNFSKLTQEQINLIFKLREQGLTQKAISEQVNCSRSNISYVLNKKTWIS